MAATIVSELQSKHQDLRSTTNKLADELTELRHRSQDLLNFRTFHPQESRLLTNTLRGAINSVEKYHPQSWLQRTRNKLLTGSDYTPDIVSLSRPVQGPLVHVIELLQTAENRTEEYKKKVTEHSEECTGSFASATSNKVTLDSLARHIGYCRDRISAETDRTNNNLSSSMQELKGKKEYQRLFHMIENDAQRKEERWKKIHKWTKPLVVTYPVTKMICWLKEVNVEEASAWIKEAELEVERVQEERDELIAQLAALSSTADRASELSFQNHDICDQSERMMQECKELAVEAEHMRNSARQVLMQLSEINNQMMLLSKTRRERLEEQKDSIKETLLSTQAAIEPLVTGRRLADSGTVRMLTLDHGQDKTPSLDAGIGSL